MKLYINLQNKAERNEVKYIDFLKMKSGDSKLHEKMLLERQ